MKATWVRPLFSLVGVALAVYFERLCVPLLVLFFAVSMDYATGMVNAYIHRTLSSRKGWNGILKKLCYFAAVCVGAGVDWMFSAMTASVGVELHTELAVSILVAMWLIVNESISILENLEEIGVPLPAFLSKLVARLKISVEKQAESATKNIEE